MRLYILNTKQLLHITHIVFFERNQDQELLLLNVIHEYNTELPKCMETLKYVYQQLLESKEVLDWLDT